MTSEEQSLLALPECPFIVRVCSTVNEGFLGTAFFISPSLAITCAHCLEFKREGDNKKGYFDSVLLKSDSHSMRGNVEHKDLDLDIAVIRLRNPLDSNNTIYLPRFVSELNSEILKIVVHTRKLAIKGHAENMHEGQIECLIHEPPMLIPRSKRFATSVQFAGGWDNGLSGSPLLFYFQEQWFLLGMAYLGTEKAATSRARTAELILDVLKKLPNNIWNPNSINSAELKKLIILNSRQRSLREKNSPVRRKDSIDKDYQKPITSESLSKLNDPDLEIIDAYLNWILTNYRNAGIPLLEGNSVELDKVYVALRGRRSNRNLFNKSSITQTELSENTENIETSTKFFIPDEQKIDEYIRSSHQAKPVDHLDIPADVENHEFKKLFKNTDETINLDKAFNSEQSLVILGDPGSGKTTLLKWIALTLAHTYRDDNKDVKVTLSKVNPESEDDENFVSLGAKRIPILIRVASFKEWRKNNPYNYNRFSDYIGFHIAENTTDTVLKLSYGEINLEDLHHWLDKMIRRNQTVLLIDGLDEVDDESERSEIIQHIKSYLEAHYLRCAEQFLPQIKAKDFDTLSDTEGNKVILTSRIVGYRKKHLSEQTVHLTIEPMSELAIKNFCKKYIFQIRRSQHTDDDWKNYGQKNTQEEVLQFINKVIALHNKGAKDITSNPIQLSFLAMLYVNNDNKLPEQRTKLYHDIINAFFKHYNKRTALKGVQADKVLNILSELAAEVLEKSSRGYITEKRLVDVLSKGHISEKAIGKILHLSSEGIGLLTMPAPNVYRFVHLSIQEYLAGRWLLSQEKSGNLFLNHLNSPRWREALLMALGQQALLAQGQKKETILVQLVNNLLTGHHSKFDQFPALLLIVAALQEMERVPDIIIQRLFREIVDSYCAFYHFEQFSHRLTQLNTAFSFLHKFCSAYKDDLAILSKEVLKTLDSGRKSELTRALVCVQLVRETSFYSLEIAKAIAKLLPFDDEDLGWPVDRALSDIACANKPLGRYRETNTLAYQLSKNTEWSEHLNNDALWQRICIVFYGGLNSRVIKEIWDIEKSLADIQSEQDQINSLPDDETRKQLNELLGEKKTSLEIKHKEALSERRRFVAKRIHRNSDTLTPYIVNALENEQDATALIAPLLDALKNHFLEPAQEAEIIAALFILDYPINKLSVLNFDVLNEVLRIFRRINHLISQAIQAAAELTIKELLSKISNEVNGLGSIKLMQELISINLKYGGKPITTVELLETATDETRSIISAELWQFLVINPSEDKLYNMAVTLDTIGKKLAQDSVTLAKTFSQLAHTATQNYSKYPGWFSNRFVRIPRNDHQLYALALEIALLIPAPLQFVRGWAIEKLSPGLINDDELKNCAIWETYVNVPDQFQSRDDALSALFNNQNNSIIEFSFPKKISGFQSSGSSNLDNYKLIDVELNRLLIDLTTDVHTDTPNCEVLNTVYTLESHIVLTDSAEAILQLIWQIIKILPSADDIENTVMVLIRLCFYLPHHIASKTLLVALKLLRSAADKNFVAITLKNLSHIVLLFPESNQLYKELIGELESPLLQVEANGLMGGYIKNCEALLSQHDAQISSLYLGAQIQFFKNCQGLSEEINTYWVNLANNKDVSLIKVRQHLAQKPVQLTMFTALGLEKIRFHEDRRFVSILKLIEHPAPEVRPLLIQWYEHSTIEIKRICTLLLAELGWFHQQTISELIEFLNDPDDKLRYRAAAVLYIENLRKSPIFRVSQIGKDTLESLALKRLEAKQKQGARLALGWAFEHVCHDDVDAINTWINQFDDLGEKKAKAASSILGSIAIIERYSAVWPTILNALEIGQPHTRRVLSRSVCMMLAWKRLTEKQWLELWLLINKTQGKCLGDSPIIEEFSSELADFIKVALNSGIAWYTFSEKFRTNKTVPLNTLYKKEPEDLKRALARIGDNCLAGERFTSRISEAAQKLNSFEYINYMLDILYCEIDEPTPFGNLLYFESELLSLLAATVEAYPDNFYQAMSNMESTEDELIQFFSDLACNHTTFTGRQASFSLLSYFRQITIEVVDAFLQVLFDVPEVQKVALESIGRYRNADATALHKLTEMLWHQSAATAYMAGLLVSNLARNRYLELDNSLITKKLIEASEDQENDRNVILLDSTIGSSDERKMLYLGKLNQLLASMVDDLTGVSHFCNRFDSKNTNPIN